MTVKKLRIQLFFSIIALMLTLVCISSATYAWFSLNSTVSADGMQINAATEGVNFEITNKYDSTEGKPVFVPGQTEVAVTFAGRSTLLPTHPNSFQPYSGNLGGIAKWHHAFSDSFNDARTDLDGDEWTSVSYDLSRGYGYYWNENADGTDSTFALAVEFFVRLNPDTTGENVVLKDIKATNLQITDSTGNNALSKCVYLLVAGSKGTYMISTTDVTTGEGEPELSGIKNETDVLIDEVRADGNYQSIVVFVFFDGKDKDCKSSNFDPGDISISLDFTGTQA